MSKDAESDIYTLRNGSSVVVVGRPPEPTKVLADGQHITTIGYDSGPSHLTYVRREKKSKSKKSKKRKKKDDSESEELPAKSKHKSHVKGSTHKVILQPGTSGGARMVGSALYVPGNAVQEEIPGV